MDDQMRDEYEIPLVEHAAKRVDYDDLCAARSDGRSTEVPVLRLEGRAGWKSS